MTLSEPEAEKSIFDRIGGEAVLDRLVEAFYGHMDTLPQAKAVRDMHDADLGEIKRVFRNYLMEWTGGPKLYSPEKGHPRLRQRHVGFPIDNSARDAWMACMDKALEETISDEAARRELAFNIRKLADWMRNKE